MAILPRPTDVPRADAAPVTERETWHGTSAGYNKRRCRCETCRAYHSARAAASRLKPIDPDRHGTQTNYQRGCRCDACRTRWNDYHRANMANRRATQRENAVAAALDCDAPGVTPEDRRDQIEHELSSRAASRRKIQLPRSSHDNLGLTSDERRRARDRAVARLARNHRDEYLRLLAEETAAAAGGRAE